MKRSRSEDESTPRGRKGKAAKMNLTRKKIVWCGSAALSPAQCRYPPIILELLATAYGMEACRFYLHGSPHFVHVTDHQALQTIMRRDMRECPPSLLPLVERTKMFNFSSHSEGGTKEGHSTFAHPSLGNN